MEHVSFNSGIK